MTSPEMTSSRCIAFSNSAPQQHRCIVVLENTVKVFDPIAGHFTLCHVMPAWAQSEMIIAARLIEEANDAACYAALDAAERWEEQELARRSNGRIY